MSARGLDATISVNGTAIALFTGVAFDWTKAVGEFTAMGSLVTTDVHAGPKKYKGSFKKAFVDWAFVNLFNGTAEMTGSIVPRTGKYILGTLIITGGSLSGMETESTAAIIEEGTFVMYKVTFASSY